MANPMNPLDAYASYTYHFELHAALNWDALAILENNDQNASTTATRPTKLPGGSWLLINTRQDAHQIIDDTMFSYIGPSADANGQFVPKGDMKMKVIEPNGISFIEKLAALMNENQVTSPNNLMWALKIIFVGRTEDNKIVKLPVHGTGIVIPVAFKQMESSFTSRGGEYHLDFVTLADFAGVTNDSDSSTLLLGYCNKDLTIKAKTVKEGLLELEKQLNQNYKETYERELLNAPNARPLNYKINIIDKRIDGRLDTSFIGAESFVAGDNAQISLSSEQTIVSWIFKILRSSDELNKVVGESLTKLQIADHYGVKILSVFPRVIYRQKSADIIYDIYFYEGSKDTMEFDFMFSDPGANVDVLGFDIHMRSALAWFSNRSTSGVGSNTNIHGDMQKTDPSKYAADNVHPDKTKNNLQQSTKQQYAIPGKSGDLALLPATPAFEKSGAINYSGATAPNARLMFNTIAACNSAFSPQLTFKIRGHLDLLTNCIITPATGVGKLDRIPFGIKSPKWIKVNVRSPEDQKSAFFYTGKYNLISIENHFSGGQFIQLLTVLMMDADFVPLPPVPEAANEQVISSISQNTYLSEAKKQSIISAIQNSAAQNNANRTSNG